jgi:RND family efflux transporter MFP subunit
MNKAQRPPRKILALLLLGAAFAAPAQEAARVSVAVPAAATFGERFSISGTLTAKRSAQLSPRVDGLVARLMVDAGDRVKAGDILLQLDTAVATQALARAAAATAEATAASDEAQRRLDEGQRMQHKSFISASQVDTLKAELRLAQAALDSARAAEREQKELLDRHTLPAPFAGVIAERLAEVGEWASRGTPVLTLVALDQVWLDLRVPQERYSDLTAETRVEVYPDALPGVKLSARIEAKVPVTEANARTFLLRLRVDDDQDRLLPGTSARAEIALPAAEPALAVSRDALLRQPDGGYSLFVVEGSGTALVARQRTVRVLRDQGDLVAVAAGLAAGERVVIRGNEQLRDGQSVQLVER